MTDTMTDTMTAPVTASTAARPLHVFLIAGEASGDVLGAALMRDLRAGGPVRFSGIGGPAMTEAGLESLFPAHELSIMGLVEILPRVWALRRRIRQTAAAIMAARPDVLLTIDSPGFCVRVVRRLSSRDCPRIHYVAPTVWAWRPGRVHTFRRHFDRLLVLLPFEPPWFADHMACDFVGHPVASLKPDPAAAAALRHRLGLTGDDRLLCLLPGSRQGEVRRLLGLFGAAVQRLAPPPMPVVIPALPHLAPGIERTVAGWPMPVTVVPASIRHDAMAAADLALAASGTVALELAALGVPAVIGYRVAPLTAWIVRRLVRVDHVNIVNIMAGRRAVPEHIQADCTASQLADSLNRILTNPAFRADILKAQANAITRLAAPPAAAATAIRHHLVRCPGPVSGLT